MEVPTEKWIEVLNLIGNLQENLRTQIDINQSLITRVYNLEIKLNQLLLTEMHKNGD
jgi:hypothetical protein